MTSTYRQKALDALGENYAPLLDAIAEQLHHNEYPHLHDLTTDVDSYCWLRAEQALAALRNHDFLHIVHENDDGVPVPDTAVPYGWALWRPDGELYFCLRADQAPGRTDGWDAVCSVINIDPKRRTEGWNVDPITEDDYGVLNSHKLSFNHPGSRDEFLTETKAADARAAQGLPTIVGYAAWGPIGELFAAGDAVRGLTGWHSLGIGGAADAASVLGLTADEHHHLMECTHLYRVPGGRADFLNWRRRGSLTDEQANTNFSSLAHAFSDAISDHSSADFWGTPPLVLGQYLEKCLNAYGAALESRGAPA